MLYMYVCYPQSGVSERECGAPSRRFDRINRLFQREMGPARCRCHKVGEILDHFESIFITDTAKNYAQNVPFAKYCTF